MIHFVLLMITFDTHIDISCMNFLLYSMWNLHENLSNAFFKEKILPFPVQTYKPRDTHVDKKKADAKILDIAFNKQTITYLRQRSLRFLPTTLSDCKSTCKQLRQLLPSPQDKLPSVWNYFSPNYSIYTRLIPQGTVDNNLGPDRSEGPNALDPNFCRQPTLWLHDLCLKVLTVHGTELRLFGAKAFPLLILLMLRIWQSSSRYNF